MKYMVIIGCGKTGKNLAYELSKTENVVVIDKSL
ncbi:MAG: NAD-binding protein, partial [Candidatus Omnitrophica bacterium]|nr:NAD-binding protein [Candidatus Omnitrophota bacterium]